MRITIYFQKYPLDYDVIIGEIKQIIDGEKKSLCQWLDIIFHSWYPFGSCRTDFALESEQYTTKFIIGGYIDEEN